MRIKRAYEWDWQALQNKCAVMLNVAPIWMEAAVEYHYLKLYISIFISTSGGSEKLGFYWLYITIYLFENILV